MPRTIIYHLSVDMVQAAKDTQARSRGSARYTLPHPLMSSLSCFPGISIASHNILFLSTYFARFSSLAPDSLTGILYALTQIGIRWFHSANLCCYSTHQLFVDTQDANLCRTFSNQRYPRRRCNLDGSWYTPPGAQVSLQTWQRGSPRHIVPGSS